jgi:hypothetical protein
MPGCTSGSSAAGSLVSPTHFPFLSGVGHLPLSFCRPDDMLVVHSASTCDVCLDGYSSSKSPPHSITCGHVFCLSYVPMAHRFDSSGLTFMPAVSNH